MNEEQKSIWKEPVQGWRLLLSWFLIVFGSVFVITYCLGIGGNLKGYLLFAVTITTVIFFLVALIRWLCCWQKLKKVIFVTATLITFLALILAEENWRGKHAWNKFRREQEALGTRFDVHSLAPTPVPDDQNFAMTPIVITCYGELFDTKLRLITYNTNRVKHNVVNRMTMAKSVEQFPEVRYPDNPVYSWEKSEITPSLENLQKYYRELASKTNLFPIPPQPQSPAEDVLLALSIYNAAVEELRQASTLPHSRFALDYNAPNPSIILLPHLAPCKSSVSLLSLRAIAELQCGHTDKAMDDIRLALRLSDTIRSEPILISHLVRLAMFKMALQPIYEGLAQHHWSDAQLAGLSDQLAQTDFLADYQTAMRAEMALSISSLDYLRQHRSEISLGEYIENFNHPSAAQRMFYRVMPDGFFFQNELTVAKFHHKWIFTQIDAQQRLVCSSFDRQKAQDALSKELKHVSSYNYFARIALRVLGKLPMKFAVAESTADLARIAVALERYRLAHGDYPETLNPLAPQFMAAIPHDIMNGQPLHYSRETDGRFTLYSVGWNQIDDDGKVVLRKGETPSVDIFEGDLVWRYPAGN